MKEIYKIGMADMNVCQAPDELTTIGLGSCVGVVLYDAGKKIGGMVHIMLPDSQSIKRNENKAKFADTGIDVLIDKMVSIGARKGSLTAKIAGGAQMFAFSANNELLRIGERNVEATKQKLKELGISILAEDTGLNYGRTIVFNTENGDLLIKSVGKENKII